MKTQATFILGLIILLGITSCIKANYKPTATATVSTFAGNNEDFGSTDGAGAATSFYLPSSLVTDIAGNIYVANTQTSQIRKISPKAVVTTIAGGVVSGFADGQGAEALFRGPSGIALDAAGNLYVGDSGNNRIRKVSLSGRVTTFAGSGEHGAADGPGATASFLEPRGVAVDAGGNVYVADASNHLIRKITPQGEATTLAGSGVRGAADGKGSAASFSRPFDVAVDAAGNVYVADTDNNLIRKINRGGVVRTLAGNTTHGSADGRGASASFYRPAGLDLDAFGNIYVADQVNNKIRKVTPQGEVTTIAGSGDYGFNNGPGATATFKQPNDVAIDIFGHIYVADINQIRKIVISR